MGDIIIDDVRRPRHFCTPQDAAESAHQIPQFHLLNGFLRHISLAGRQIAHQSRILLLPRPAPFFKDAGRIAKLLVFQKTPNQLLAGILKRFFDFVRAGKNLLRFDFDERARHGEEIADGIDVQLLEHRQVFQVLLGDRGDRDIDNLNLMLAHQVQEQIERTSENIQTDPEIHQLNLCSRTAYPQTRTGSPLAGICASNATKRLSGKGDRHPKSCTSLRRGPLHPGASPRFRTNFSLRRPGDLDECTRRTRQSSPSFARCACCGWKKHR